MRAHRDYQARLLTDAVMTVIAVQETFADEFLEGLLPLLRSGSRWLSANARTASGCLLRGEAVTQPGTPSGYYGEQVPIGQRVRQAHLEHFCPGVPGSRDRLRPDRAGPGRWCPGRVGR